MSDYLIENIMPKFEVHLLAGVTGVGKTTWLFHMLTQQWAKGLDVLGEKSHPVPWVYVAADRSLASAHRTMNAMGVPLRDVNIIPAHGADHKTFPQIIESVKREGAELAVIEAFGSFVEEPGTHRKVSDFMHAAAAHTSPSIDFPNGLTIIGVVESPKMKPSERYALPRQRISGVATWGHMADAIFLIEHEFPKKQGHPGRILYACRRIGRDLELKGGFNNQNQLIF